MTLHRFTADAGLALVASRSVHPVGAFIEPLIDGERTILCVVERHEYDDEPGHAWKYDAVDAHGARHEVLRMDDPRAADEEQIAEFQAERERAKS